MSLSIAKLQANRRNAQKSTGPRTAEGKARSSRNAITHGIFCAELLLEDEDPSALHALREAVLHRLRPRDAVEAELVEQYLSCTWRLKRLRRAETDAYHQQAEAMGNQSSSGQLMRCMLEAESRTLEKLGRYEQRLFSGMLRCSKELRILQNQEVEELEEMEDRAIVEEQVTAGADGQEEVEKEVEREVQQKLQNEATAAELRCKLNAAQQLAKTLNRGPRTPAQRIALAVEKALYPGAIPTPKSFF
jgi:hypothetical protein